MNKQDKWGSYSTTNKRLDALESSVYEMRKIMLTILRTIDRSSYVKTLNSLGKISRLTYEIIYKYYNNTDSPISYSLLKDRLEHSDIYSDREVGKYQVANTLDKNLVRLRELNLIDWVGSSNERLIEPIFSDILKLLEDK